MRIGHIQRAGLQAFELEVLMFFVGEDMGRVLRSPSPGFSSITKDPERIRTCIIYYLASRGPDLW